MIYYIIVCLFIFILKRKTKLKVRTVIEDKLYFSIIIYVQLQ
jgi:hypothetical protein